MYQMKYTVNVLKILRHKKISGNCSVANFGIEGFNVSYIFMTGNFREYFLHAKISCFTVPFTFTEANWLECWLR